MIYLDYAATTPVDPEVLKAMLPYLSRDFGNPGSLHEFGQKALAAIDESRATIARFLAAEPKEIIFTGSTTLACSFDVTGKAKAKWDVVVINPDGQIGIFPEGFQIL